jgi:hypothetical protein
MAEEIPQFAVITGPVVGEFTLADGTVYDASPDSTVVDSQEHADELMYLIGLHYERHGHPRHDRHKPFKMDRKDPKMKKFAADRSFRIHPDNDLEG